VEGEGGVVDGLGGDCSTASRVERGEMRMGIDSESALLTTERGLAFCSLEYEWVAGL